MQPDPKVAALAALPLPYYDQKTLVALNKPAALKCRTQYRHWIAKPKEAVSSFVKALSGEKPEWRIFRYKHEVEGQLREVFRCPVTLPLSPPVTVYGDAVLVERADLTAALHVLFYLLSRDLITPDGLPRLPQSPPLSSSDSPFTSSSSPSGSSTSDTKENLERSFTSREHMPTSRATTMNSSASTAKNTLYSLSKGKGKSVASSSSSISDTEDIVLPAATGAAMSKHIAQPISHTSSGLPLFLSGASNSKRAPSPSRGFSTTAAAPSASASSSRRSRSPPRTTAPTTSYLQESARGLSSMQPSLLALNSATKQPAQDAIFLEPEHHKQAQTKAKYSPSPKPSGPRSRGRRSRSNSVSSTSSSPAGSHVQANGPRTVQKPAEQVQAMPDKDVEWGTYGTLTGILPPEAMAPPQDGSGWAKAEQACENTAAKLEELARGKAMPHQIPPTSQPQAQAPAAAPGRHEVSLELARGFIDFYCSKFKYPKADLQFKHNPSSAASAYHATMTIRGRAVGNGLGGNMKEATSLAYIDACHWMASCDANIWMDFLMEDASKKTDEARSWLASKATNKQDVVPALQLSFSDRLDAKLREVIWQARESELHRKALTSRAKAEAEVLRVKQQREQAATRAGNTSSDPNANVGNGHTHSYTYEDPMKTDALRNKSRELQDRQERYKSEPRHAKMRATRASLPITNHADMLLQGIEDNPVLVVMAQTGSGKTTQLPQLILDDYIAKGKGARCNVICTQPRRLAAISVAQRVAAERGEQTGRSVGYQVRFENSFPEKDGSILFMTSGIFLRRMQVGLEEMSNGKSSFLDEVSHVIVDEVHERDIDVDLLLFILRRQLEERRKAGKPEFKVVLMSATIDPSLFRNYFQDPKSGNPAPAVSIPGRTYPVEKYYLDDLYSSLQRHSMYQQIRWVFEEKDVKPYLTRELQNPLEHSAASRTDDDLKFPAQLVALIVAFVAYRTSKTQDGHILVFLPGLDEIKNVQKVLLDPQQALFNMNFGRYEMHILHSEVPVAEQQLVFAPAPPGVQRIILSTNIAETSVTIPDVVYVVDAGKCKEKRFDPERHLSSLVQAFTGLGNMGQRAGRAGRHRPGEYYSLVSHSRLRCLPQNQTVEMKRLDLSNVVMHVKGLNLPMEVEDVLDECIEPPGHERVIAAIKTLERVGALDPNKNLTSLGKVLLHLPVEAAIGKLCLLGCFFRCLDQVLTIAALLTNRDPFVSPLDRRFEANMAKKRFCPPGYVSDTLTSLKAFNEWASLPSFYEQRAFCDENFLAMGGLRTIEKLKMSLLQSLDRAGVLSLAAGGDRLQLVRNRDGVPVLPNFLNANGENLPLLAALISCATAPGFAVRKSPSLLRTPQDSMATLHSSSIITIMGKKAFTNKFVKEVFAYTEAVKNVSKGGAGQSNGLKMNSQLRGATLLDPLGLLLFGVHQLEIMPEGFLCDGWLPMTGQVAMLDDLGRFKDVLNASLLRAFEGLGASMLQRSKRSTFGGRAGEYTASDEYEDSPEEDTAISPLSDQEIDDLDRLASNVVEVLQQNALDNGLPPKYELARLQSVEDQYVAEQYKVRVSHTRPSEAKPTKRVEKSYGEWDKWGGNAQDKPTNRQDPPAPNSQQVTNTQKLPEAPQPALKIARTEQQASSTASPKADAEDPWASWNGTSTRNDAYDRRANMRHRSSSDSSSTRTAPRISSPKPAKLGSGAPSTVSSTSTFTSPSIKTNGWIGTQNLDAVQSGRKDGWRVPAHSTQRVAPQQSEMQEPPSTPSRKPAAIVETPTASGSPEQASADSLVWTTGWGKYDRYNPRTRSMMQGSLSPNSNISPSQAKTFNKSAGDDDFPELSDPSQSIPMYRKEPPKSNTPATGWGDWQPTRTKDGEPTTKGGQPKPWMSSGLVPSQIRRSDSPAVRLQPVGTATANADASHSSDQLRGPAPATSDYTPTDKPPPVTEASASTDDWSGWTAKVDPDAQGAQNFQRRAAMARGEVLPPAQAAGPPATTQAYQYSEPPRPVQPEAAPQVNTSIANTNSDSDPWANYKPKETSNNAFDRRAAMGISASASSSQSSTSSTHTPFRPISQLRPAKAMSIVGSAKREADATAARGARGAGTSGGSDLHKRIGSLNIRGSARAASVSGSNNGTSDFAARSHAAMTSTPQQSSPYTTAATAQASAHGPSLGEYSIPLRQPQGPSSSGDLPPRGFNNMRTNVLPTSSNLSDISSDSGTFISKQTIDTTASTHAHPIANGNGIVPAGGIGWD